MLSLAPLTIDDEEIRKDFPEDQDQANELATEMLRQALLARGLPSDMQVKNRPDWQAALDLGRREIETGQVVTHEEHLAWKHRTE